MKQRILFLCTENSARSQMAEALVNTLYGDRFMALSAGTEPSTVDKRALQAIERLGLHSQGLASKTIAQLPSQSFDYTITLCDKAQRECKFINFGGQHLAWDFPDPKSRNIPKPFDVTLKEIHERFKMFMMVLDKPNNLEPVTPLQLFKCLADETRLLMMFLIHAESELCVGDLAVALELSQPKISRHLAQLREHGLLTDRRQGQWVYYQIDPTLPDWAYSIVQEAKRRSVVNLTPYLARLHATSSHPEGASLS